MSLAQWGLKSAAPGRVRISHLAVLYRARLRRRWVSELMAILGIAVGVALVYAAHVASTSLSAPVHSLNRGIVGTSQLEITARGGTFMPGDIYNKVLAIDGVVRAAPILQVPGNVVGQRGERGVLFYGADPRIVKLRGTLLLGFTGSQAAEQQTVVLTSAVGRAVGARVGDDIRLQLAGRTLTLPAVIAGHADIGALADTSLALVPLRYLRRIAQVGDRFSRILVQAAPGHVDDVRRRLDHAFGTRLNVASSNNDSALFDRASRPTSEATTVFSTLAALVGWLFAVCGLLVTASDRRALAVEQRYQGQPPSVTVATLLFDAAVVGGLGVACGLLAGEVVSRQGFSSDVSFLSGAFPIGDHRVVTWQSFAIASVGGLIASTVGVLGPVRNELGGLVAAPRLSRRGKAHVPWPPWSLPALGLGTLVASIVLAIVAPSAVLASIVLLGLALTALLPIAVSSTIGALRRLSLLSRHAWWSVVLALQQLSAQRWRARTVAIAMTGAIAVFGATTLQGSRVNLQEGLDSVTELTAPPGIWVAPAGAGSLIGTAMFQPTAGTSLQHVPGVRAVALNRSALLDIAGRRAWVIGQPADVRSPVPSRQILDGSGPTASQIASGGWVTLSRELATTLNVDVGDRVTLPTPTPISLRVIAITTNLGWSSGGIVVGAEDFRTAWGTDAISAYHLHLDPGVAPELVRDRVARALGTRSGLHVETAAQRAVRQKSVSRAGLARLRQITTLTLIAAVLAMTVAMIGLLWQHRPIVKGMKFDGAGTGLIWRMLLIETGVLFSVGAVVGGCFGLLGQALAATGVEVVTGFPVVHALRPGVAVMAVGVVVGASLLVMAVPGYYIARVRPDWR